MKPITIIKCDEQGREVLRYSGTELNRTAHSILVEAYFTFQDTDLGMITLSKGDRFLEWFYSDRGYNIFEVHGVETNHLKGWYCNITRPAIIADDFVQANDLALDVVVELNGVIHILDQVEFDELDIPSNERQQAKHALQQLLERVQKRIDPFDQIQN